MIRLTTTRFAKVESAMRSISSFFVITLGSDLSSEYIGIYQRIIEFLFILWVVLCAFEIKKNGYTL